MRFALVSLLFCGAAFAASEASVKPFNDRLAEYVKLRKAAVENAPQLDKKSTPEQIQHRETAVAEQIRRARVNAKPGDILGPEIRPIFDSILKDSLSGPGTKDTRAAIKEGNPRNEKSPGEVDPVIKVNAIYPKAAPLSTVPPDLLARLPKLPKNIEYRFVGRTLILRDAEANLIIDYMKEAVPKP
jgi:hypothetical protein